MIDSDRVHEALVACSLVGTSIYGVVMGTSLVITRVEAPDFKSELNEGAAVHELGGQREWCWAMPLPYRVLAAPASWQPMPVSPRSVDPASDFFPFLSYWASLRSFLSFSFGWTRHDKGLAWWYGAGRPTVDPRFQLLEAVWERDGMLERYFAWCSERQPYIETGLETWAERVDRRPAEVSADRAEQFRRARAEAETSPATPWGKHLEDEFHIGGAAFGDVSGEMTIVPDAFPPRAVLVCESSMGWYRSLIELGATLPTTSSHSWRVDVFVRPIGFVGTYRRSWKSNLWFSGQHRYHEVGN